MDDELAQVLREAREKAGLTQSDIHRAAIKADLNVHQGELSRYELRERGEGLARTLRIVQPYALALDVPPADLLREAIALWEKGQRQGVSRARRRVQARVRR